VERARIRARSRSDTRALVGARRALTIFRANANDEDRQSASLLGDWALEPAAGGRGLLPGKRPFPGSEAQRSLSVLRAEELRRGGHFAWRDGSRRRFSMLEA
jgi:hypothetical protein